MTGLCLAVAAVIRAALPVTEFTLAWTHSVEKVRWEEDYRVSRWGLEPSAARVKGSGAGMEPPPDAVLRNGVWHYRPAAPALPKLVLTISPYTSDYALCWDGGCKMLTEIVSMPVQPGIVEIFPCRAAPSR